MFLVARGGGCGESSLGWDYPDESLGSIPRFAEFLTFPLPMGSGTTQPWSQDGFCPLLPCLSPAAYSVRAWHRATSPEQEERKRVSPSGCQLSQLTQLDTLPPPARHTASNLQSPNFPFFRPGRWFSFSEGGTPPPTARGCQQQLPGTLPQLSLDN